MVVSFSIIGVLVLALIFLVLRSQNMQKELALTRNTVKSNTKKITYAFHNLVLMSKELQKVYASRVDNAHKKGLISGAEYSVLSIIMHNFSQITMDCCEKGDTVEEALSKALKDTEVTMESVRELIKEKPSEIRVAWCRNTVDGFMAACHALSQSALNIATESKDAKTS